MKPFLFLFLSLIISLSCAPDPEIVYVTSAKGLRVRSEPSQESKILGTLKHGDAIMAFEESGPELLIQKRIGRWRRVKMDELSGWAFGGYLASTKPQPPEPPKDPIIGTWQVAGGASVFECLKIDGQNQFFCRLLSVKNNRGVLASGNHSIGDVVLDTIKPAGRGNYNAKAIVRYTDLLGNSDEIRKDIHLVISENLLRAYQDGEEKQAYTRISQN